MEVATDWQVFPEDRVEEVVYARRDGMQLRMMVMRPEAASSSEGAPCLVFVHGGGFTGGTAEMLLPYCRYFARRGYLCFTVDYRLMTVGEEGSPLDGSITLADCIADCKAAVRYVRKHAGRWQGNSQRIALIGESAGGYLACAVAALAHVEEEDWTNISCVPELLIAFNPITHLLGKWKMRVEHERGQGTAGDSAADKWLRRHLRARELSPLLHLSDRSPATLVVHGLADTIVPPEDSADYVERLRLLGTEGHLVLLPECGHAFALTRYRSSDEIVEQSFKLMLGFFRKSGFSG